MAGLCELTRIRKMKVVFVYRMLTMYEHVLIKFTPDSYTYYNFMQIQHDNFHYFDVQFTIALDTNTFSALLIIFCSTNN